MLWPSASITGNHNNKPIPETHLKGIKPNFMHCHTYATCTLMPLHHACVPWRLVMPVSGRFTSMPGHNIRDNQHTLCGFTGVPASSRWTGGKLREASRSVVAGNTSSHIVFRRIRRSCCDIYAHYACVAVCADAMADAWEDTAGCAHADICMGMF